MTYLAPHLTQTHLVSVFDTERHAHDFVRGMEHGSKGRSPFDIRPSAVAKELKLIADQPLSLSRTREVLNAVAGIVKSSAPDNPKLPWLKHRLYRAELLYRAEQAMRLRPLHQDVLDMLTSAKVCGVCELTEQPTGVGLGVPIKGAHTRLSFLVTKDVTCLHLLVTLDWFQVALSHLPLPSVGVTRDGLLTRMSCMYEQLTDGYLCSEPPRLEQLILPLL